MPNKFIKQKLLVAIMLVTSTFTPAAYIKGQAALNTPAKTTNQNGVDNKKRVATEPFVRTELFFGTDRDDAPDVTDEEFNWFLDAVVTPEFPDGLTLLSGKGQFCCDANGAVIQEGSKLLILFYPLATQKESSEKIEKIRKDYKNLFHQQSVLRVDDPRPVRVSF
ncbi:MAG: DUF3574 domain-containing protein [Acidobacteriota bacterium]|nr:DUF3574 domain-containing protein [Acidobacteriota bacterium]